MVVLSSLEEELQMQTLGYVFEVRFGLPGVSGLLLKLTHISFPWIHKIFLSSLFCECISGSCPIVIFMLISFSIIVTLQ